ncbi:MAG TPA: hypothetical protein VK605_07925 [Solirubrobacteraceae bacterium]|nr:hypothetical protein [Solirubrobacteraceae bacterium]
MDKFLLRLFQAEVQLQCKFVLRSVEQLEQWEREVADHDAEMLRQHQAEQEVRTKQLEATARGEMELSLEYTKQRTAMLGSGKPMPDLTAGAWFALQNLLVAAANLSKLLWGSSGKREVERKALRDSVGVDNTSALKSLDIRNDFEHFDERIEDWYVRQGKSGYVGRNIGGGIHIENEGEGRRFGEYDPSTGMVIFWTNSAHLPAVIGEVRRIIPLVEAGVAKNPW